MYGKSVFLLIAAWILLTSVVHAQQEDGLKVGDMVFCTAVENREAVGADKIFPETVERVYCLTRIDGAADTTTVSHVWYYGDEEKARVDLPVRSKSWRTWSSKLILKEWEGVWRVDVLSSNGRLLASKEFIIKPASD